MRIGMVLWILVGALALQAAPSLVQVAEAKGPPTRVRITGPDLPNGIEVKAARVLETLSPRTLQHGGTPLPSGKGPGEPVSFYVITRYYGAYGFDQIRYVPEPGGPGRLFADGIVYHQPFFVNGVEWQPRAPGAVGRWWVPSPEAERVLRALLSLSDETPAPEPSCPSLSDLVTGLLVATLLIGAAAIGSQRHRDSITPTP
jgi:hypothetical protein